VKGSGENGFLEEYGGRFPIDWPEPFGLVMIEAMGCGTPGLAFDRGSVREVIDHGVTGWRRHRGSSPGRQTGDPA
jgi:glycosyltransferase involved in cell wall biosynthesis